MNNYIVDMCAFYENSGSFKKITLDFDGELAERLGNLNVLLTAINFGLHDSAVIGSSEINSNRLTLLDLVVLLYNILILDDYKTFYKYSNDSATTILSHRNILINIEEE